jgi:hypothetical protein
MMYCKSVKGAKLIEGGSDEETTVEVVKCESASTEVAKREEYVCKLLGSKALGETIARKLTASLKGRVGRKEKSPAEELDDQLLSRLGVGNLCKFCGKVSGRKCGRGNVCYMCKRFPSRQKTA